MSDTKTTESAGRRERAASETETRHEPETVEIEDRRQKSGGSEIEARGSSATTVVEQAAAPLHQRQSNEQPRRSRVLPFVITMARSQP